MSIEETIKEQIDSNSILLYMKGNPEQPQVWLFCTGNADANVLRQAICLRRYSGES